MTAQPSAAPPGRAVQPRSQVARRAAQMRDALIAEGIRATTDPARVEPPCIVIVPTATRFNLLQRGGATVQWTLTVVGPQPGGESTLDAICDMVAAVLYVDSITIEEGELTSYRADTGDPWPAMALRFTEASSWV